MFKYIFMVMLVITSFSFADDIYGKWIATTDKLKPNDKEDVIAWIISVKPGIYVGRNPTLSTYSERTNSFSGENIGYKVTHWIRIPPPPKE